MKVKILKDEEKEMEIAVDSLTIASMLSKYLSEDPRVEFASFRQDHPLVEEVRLYLKVKEGSAKEVLKDTVNKAISDVKYLKEALLSSLS